MVLMMITILTDDNTTDNGSPFHMTSPGDVRPRLLNQLSSRMTWYWTHDDDQEDTDLIWKVSIYHFKCQFVNIFILVML